MTRDQYGVWSITVPAKHGVCAIPHDSKIKISMLTPGGERIERLPAWIKRVTQDLEVSPVYDARFWNPPPSERYQWKHPRPPKPKAVKVYEAHVGISTTEMRVGTYKEFTKNILGRIKDLGYNTIQLMAVMEHAYYACEYQGWHGVSGSNLTLCRSLRLSGHKLLRCVVSLRHA